MNSYAQSPVVNQFDESLDKQTKGIDRAYSTPRLEYIPCLDGIRAMAAVMVMTFHFVGHHGESALTQKLSVFGQTGVDLFFVLSGFLITRILLNTRGAPRYFTSFYVRRTLRIFPLYYGFLVIYFFLLPPLLSSGTPAFRTQIWSWFYLENIPATFRTLVSSGPAHFWSLAVEEHFYLLWPFLVYLFPGKKFPYCLIAALIAPLLLRVFFVANGIEVFYFTLTRMDSIGFGALLAFLDLTGELRKARTTFLIRVALVGLPLVLVPCFLAFSGTGGGALQILKSSLIPAFFFALLGFVVSDPSAGAIRRLLAIRPLRWLGSISYGLYVFHPSCFLIVAHIFRSAGFFVDLLVSFGLTLLVATVSFVLFESPLIRLKERFRSAQPDVLTSSHSIRLRPPQK